MNPRTTSSIHRRRLLAGLAGLAVCAAAAAPVPAAALESCKAKIAKDGAIQVSAKGVTGVLEWGNALGQETNAFANAATCLDGGSATKCELGPAGSAQRITPPELCTVFLADGGGACSAFLKGCTPGLRTIGSGFVAKSGDVMTGPLRAHSIDTAFGVPGCGVGDVCAQARLIAQFGGADISGDLVLNDGIRQGASTGGVVKAALVIDCDNSPTITRFFNTTGTGPFSVTGGGIASPGECVVTAPFTINTRFFSATGLDDASIGTNDTLVTVDVVNATQFRVRRATENLGVMNGANGPVSIVIY
jgi:hypothetical protein